MKQTVSKAGFIRAFQLIRPENFSVEGLEALFDYLEECKDSSGQEFELDVIAICCDFAEFDSLEEFQDNYGNEFKTLTEIEEETTLIPLSGGGFIIMNF